MLRKFPIVLQRDSMQCGIACLQMVCEYFGRKHTLEYIEQLCLTTSEGVSLLGISRAADKLGLRTVCGRMSIEQLEKIPLPAILHWNQNHFVVLYRIKRNGRIFCIADPSKGYLEQEFLEFERNWISIRTKGEERGIAMILQPTPSFLTSDVDNKQHDRHTFCFLLAYVKQYHRYFGHIIITLIIGSAIQIVLPFFTQAIVDVGIAHQSLDIIWLILLSQLMLVIGRTLSEFIRRWLLLHISMRINISLISDFFIKLLKLPMSFFDTKLMGDLIQRISDHERVNDFLTQRCLNVLFSLLSFVILGLVLLTYNGQVFLVFALGSILYVGWISLFLRKRKTIDYELFEKQANNHNKTYQFLSSIQEIKLQNCEQRRRWEWEDGQALLFGAQQKSLKLRQWQESGCIFISELRNIVITVLTATAVIQGNMTIGMMLAVQYIIGQLNYPMEQLMSFIYTLQDVRISLERINDIHLRPDEENKERTISAINGESSLHLSGVCFKYDQHSPKFTIENVSFDILEGKVTAIVGASGSGKTTILKLLLGYYPVIDGNIKIGSDNISDINLKWWRKQCGVVMQNGIIFSESIARNIAVEDEDIDEARLYEAARIACVSNFIESLPLRYNTKIGPDGIGLSQGQKQRILIARAVYKHPKFIFLDEATNSLDAANERAIIENLANFYKGRTVVVVAHRLSTVCNADQIAVMESGRIVEFGNHQHLIDKKGVYYNLVRNQLELGN